MVLLYRWVCKFKAVSNVIYVNDTSLRFKKEPFTLLMNK